MNTTPPAPHPATPRLGIVISMFPELHETFILRELAALERAGVAFDIYSLQFPRDPITLDDARRLSAQRTRYAKLFALPCLLALAHTLLHHPWRLARAIGQVAWVGRDRPGDVVKNLAILPLTLHFGALGRQRGTVHWHGHWANIPTTACWYLQQIHGAGWSAAIHGEDIFSANRFLAFKLEAARFAVVCSDHFCQYLKGQLGLSRPQDIHLNYHGLDPRVMQRVALGSTASADRGCIVTAEPAQLLSIGRLVPTKGHDTLIRAVALLNRQARAGKAPPVHLTIIGSGPEHDTLESLIEEQGAGGDVTLAGALAFEAVLDALQHCDVFCLAPRLLPGQPPDGIPNVLAEAMALQVPVVTTRVSAIPELVEDRVTGRLVAVDDAPALARAVAGTLTDSAGRERQVSAAFDKVSQLFDQQANIDELLKLFDHYVPGLSVRGA